MAWRRPGDKPLPEQMMVCLPTHICVTRPQWVNSIVKTMQLLQACTKPWESKCNYVLKKRCPSTGKSIQPTNNPRKYCGPSRDWTHNLQTEETSPSTNRPARSFYPQKLCQNTARMAGPWWHWPTEFDALAQGTNITHKGSRNYRRLNWLPSVWAVQKYECDFEYVMRKMWNIGLVWTHPLKSRYVGTF